MQRDLARPLALALLCVIAIAVASATLTDPVTTGPGSRDDLGEGGAGDEGDEWNPFHLNISEGEPSEDAGGSDSFDLMSVCVSFLKTAEAKAAILLVLLLLSAALYREGRWIAVVAGLAAVTPPGFIAYAFLTSCGPRGMGGAPWSFDHGNVSNMTSVGGSGGSGGGGAATDPPLLLLAVLGVLAVALAAAFVRSTDDDELPEETEPEPDDEPDDEALAAMGDVAGDAADRIEDAADLENEVFRAWREMTDLLDVPNPESSTPREFEAAARDAGMRREHVGTLTDLFEEVRYGGAEPTPDREEAAVAALRRIEDAYADEEGSA